MRSSRFMLVLGLCLASAGAQAPLALPADIVSWWKGDGDYLDLYAGNTATPSGTTTFTTGAYVGDSFWFDGAASQLSCGNDTSLQLTTFTVEAWVRFEASEPSVVIDMHIASKMVPSSVSGTANVDGWSLFQPYGTDVFWACFGNYSGTNMCPSATHALQTTTTTVVGTWHHVALTYDESTSTASLYMDGLLEDQITTLDTTTSFNNTNAADFIIGQNMYGEIDELTIYSRALTATEISDIHAAGSAGKCDEVTNPYPGNDPDKLAIDVEINGNPVAPYCSGALYDVVALDVLRLDFVSPDATYDLDPFIAMVTTYDGLLPLVEYEPSPGLPLPIWVASGGGTPQLLFDGYTPTSPLSPLLGGTTVTAAVPATVPVGYHFAIQVLVIDFTATPFVRTSDVVRFAMN